jgi:molybdopterin molybdotransferase
MGLMISLTEARALIWERLSPLPPQMAMLADVYGRVLREDVYAPEDIPAFDRSAMDGYALIAEDNSPRLRITGEIQPGAAPVFKIERGECARIFTGAPLPEGATQVLMQEDARVEDGFMTRLQASRIGHIRYRGEDARRGDLLLSSGTRLGQGELALLAGMGITKPTVSPPIRIVHFVTGNEIIEPSHTPLPGQIRDSNSTLVAAFARRHQGEIVHQERVSDDLDMLLTRVRAGLDDCDLLLISGGASVGDYDFGKKILIALGFEVHFEKVNIRPGKPLIFATRGQQAAFVLPGNPVSHFVTLQVEVRHAMERFAGAEASWPEFKAKLTESFTRGVSTRETFWPARLSTENGELVVRALRWKSSGDVTGMAGANALLHLTNELEPPRTGDRVPTLLVDTL